MERSNQSTHWWQAIDRRTLGKGSLAFAVVASMSGCSSEEAVAGDSLSLQRKHGWNMGAEENRLLLRNTSNVDSTGESDWRQYTDPSRLVEAWRPRSREWEPYFVPTLLQSLQSTSLRAQIRPIVTVSMKRAFQRAETLRRDLLSQVEKGPETLFIADLRGPEAVAFGAGMAGWADVIPAFDNWPHPFGVVQSQETLAAMLYYASYVRKQKKEVPDPPPGLVLLDSERLAAYTDDNTKFDNRYLANVPLVEALQKRGVKNVMYVVPDRGQKVERDDLNDEFVEYKDANINVQIFPLSDLEQVRETVAQVQPDGSTRHVVERNYYYGGGFGSHLGFLMMYSFLAPRPFAFYNHSGIGGRRMTMNNTRTTTRPPRYAPQARATKFSASRVGGARGVGRSKPSGFGRSTVRTSGGRVTGVGRSAGRSGSFGRGGFATSG